MKWAPDPAALDMLERAGPFETAAYRTACVEALPGAADVSFGASTCDGATAAVALVRQGRTAHLPFGYSGIRTSGDVAADDVHSFLSAARRASGAQRLIVYDVLDPAAGGRAVGVTSIAYLDRPPWEGFATKGRQSVRRATRAGATCEATSDPTVFVDIYERRSRAWRVSYPAVLFGATAEHGAAQFFDVRVEGRAVGSVVALRGEKHWMYWLAAQEEEGRRAEVGYLAVLTMLDAARAAGASFVNLGASANLPGVAQFKRRLGGIDHPILEWRDAPVIVGLAERLGALRFLSKAT